MGVDWIHLARDGIHWPDLMSVVMKLRVPQRVGNFMISLTSERLSAS
jgi:hypothetical protein